MSDTLSAAVRSPADRSGVPGCAACVAEFSYAPPRGFGGGSSSVGISIEAATADDHLGRIIRETRCFYERDLLEHIAAWGPRGGTYVDVGANIGNHSVYFGKFLADRVIAIEPSARLVPVLERNLRMNGVRNAWIASRAVGARAGRGRLELAEECGGNVGMTRVQAMAADAPIGRDVLSVEIVTLDALVAECGRPYSERISFIKIDVEGMELDVLRGAESILGEHRPQLAVELASAPERSTVLGYLEQYGYEPVGKFCATPTYHLIDRRVHAPPVQASTVWGWWGAVASRFRR